MNQQSKVFIANRHRMVAESLAKDLERELGDSAIVSFVAPSDSDASADTDLSDIDLALLDTSPIFPSDAIQQEQSETRIVLLSAFDHPLDLARVYEAYPRLAGCISLCDPVPDLVDAVRTLLAENTKFLSEKFRQRYDSDELREQLGVVEQIGKLSDREREVLIKIGEGLSSRQLAEALEISIKTIETHKEHIKGKLNLSSSYDIFPYLKRYDLFKLPA